MHPLVLIFLLANAHFNKPLSGLRPVASATLSILILAGTPPGHLVAALCPGDPAALALQDENLHVLQQLTDVDDIAVGSLLELFCTWVVAELVSLSALPHPHHHKLSSMIPASSLHASGSKS